MFLAIAGLIKRIFQSFPSYGTLLSSSCNYEYVSDYQNTQWQGYFQNVSVYADGNGGSFTNTQDDFSGCWYPYGYCYNYGASDGQLFWQLNNGGGSGNLTWGQTYGGTFSDGGGGTYSSGGVNDYYYGGYIIYDNGQSQAVYDGSGNWHENYYNGGGPSYDSYGTKYGYPFWDGNSNMLLQNVADGNGGSLNISWDGYYPYPNYGTQVMSPMRGTNNFYDAVGEAWALDSYTNYYADGNGGTWTTNTLAENVYYPYQYHLNAPYIVNTNHYTSNTSDDIGQTVYMYGWMNDIADGLNGGITQDTSYDNYIVSYRGDLACPPYGYDISDPFWYNGVWSVLRSLGTTQGYNQINYYIDLY